MTNIVNPGSRHETDVVIIGAGPCGLFQVFELGLLDMKAHLIDNLDKIGGQCAELYPDKNLYDIPSRPAITGQELTDDLITQAEPFSPTYHLNQLTSKIDVQENHIEITTNLDTVIKCKSLVIAAGSGRSLVAGGLDKTPEGPPGSKSYEQRVAGEMRDYIDNSKEYGRYFQDVDQLVQNVKDKERQIEMNQDIASMSPDDAMQQESTLRVDLFERAK